MTTSQIKEIGIDIRNTPNFCAKELANRHNVTVEDIEEVDELDLALINLK